MNLEFTHQTRLIAHYLASQENPWGPPVFTCQWRDSWSMPLCGAFCVVLGIQISPHDCIANPLLTEPSPLTPLGSVHIVFETVLLVCLFFLSAVQILSSNLQMHLLLYHHLFNSLSQPNVHSSVPLCHLPGIMVCIRQLVTKVFMVGKNQYLICEDAAFVSAAVTVSQTVILTREIYFLCFWGPSPCFVLCGVSFGAISTREGRASEVSVWVSFLFFFFFL